MKAVRRFGARPRPASPGPLGDHVRPGARRVDNDVGAVLARRGDDTQALALPLDLQHILAKADFTAFRPESRRRALHDLDGIDIHCIRLMDTATCRLRVDGGNKP